MKKILLTSIVTACAALAFQAPAFAAPAIIITEFGCGLLDGNGDFAFTTDTKSVTTTGGDGTIMLKCQADVANDTGKAVNYDFEGTSLSCGTSLGGTDQWHQTVSASGKATLTCHINGN